MTENSEQKNERKIYVDEHGRYCYDKVYTVDLCKHRCDRCNYFWSKKKLETRKLTFTEKLEDWLKNKCRPEIVLKTTENWCDKHGEHVEPDEKRLCFEYTGHHADDFYFQFKLFIENGKPKVTFP